MEVRDQYESRLSVEIPLPSLALLFEGPEGKRDCRNRRNLVPEILQETTGRTSETGPKTGWPG